MQYQNLSKYAISSIIALVFFFSLGIGLAYSEENQASPLFEESLQETLEEFRSSTQKVIVVSSKDKKQDKSHDYNDGDNDGYDNDEDDDSKENGRRKGKGLCNRPTFSGASTCYGTTCRGVRCYGFPTLVGRTCSVTCGVRSTCSHGRFCRNYPSPYSKSNDLDLMAKENKKSFVLTIF